MKRLRLNSLRLSKIKRLKNGFMRAIFVPTGTQFAQIGFACKGGKEFSLSTGNNDGQCEVTYKDGEISGAICKDNSGNSAKVECNQGQGGSCTQTSGSGTCN